MNQYGRKTEEEEKEKRGRKRMREMNDVMYKATQGDVELKHLFSVNPECPITGLSIHISLYFTSFRSVPSLFLFFSLMNFCGLKKGCGGDMWEIHKSYL